MSTSYKKIALNGPFWLKWAIPIFLILTILVAQLFPLWIENTYSMGFYVGISRSLRMLTGWLPFSLGDLMYILVGIILFSKLVRAIIDLSKNGHIWRWISSKGSSLIRFLMWSYIIFNIFWAMNYSRLGITYQLDLKKYEYCKEDVTALTNTLIQKVNTARRNISDTALPQPLLANIFEEAKHCYGTASKQFPFLEYRQKSVKSSLYSPLGNYFGFTGYYNPFSGEAQVRNDVPSVLIPYITCHEMAHQIGYASESEANFVGYLAASVSDDVYFRYSVYLDLFDYAQREEIKTYIIDRDTTGLKTILLENRKNLDSLVKMDRRKIREFFFKRQNNISPVVSSIYDQYLKMNKQMAGIDSYNEVIGWLLAYQKKFGKL